MYTNRVPQEKIQIKEVEARKIILQPGDATRYEFLIALNRSAGWPLVEVALLNFNFAFVLTWDSRFLFSAWQEMKDLSLSEQVQHFFTTQVRADMPENCNNPYTARAAIEASAIFLAEIGITKAEDLETYSDNPLGGDM